MHPTARKGLQLEFISCSQASSKQLIGSCKRPSDGATAQTLVAAVLKQACFIQRSRILPNMELFELEKRAGE